MSKPLILEIKEKAEKNALWENTNKSASFNAQTINLASSDYDYLIIFAYRNNSANLDRTVTVVIEKNKHGELMYSDYYHEVARAWSRQFEITDNKIKFYDAIVHGEVNNYTLVPYKILASKY